MIYEFAIDPELLLHWSKPKQFKFWRDQFGLGKARVATALSSKKKWKKIAREVLRRAEFTDDLDSTRAEQLVKLISGDEPAFPVVERRDAVFDGDLTWLDNALREHNRYPLQGILTPSTHRIEAVVIDATDYSVDSPAWDLPAEAPVPRTAEDFSSVLGPMLRAASKVVFVDPHLDFGLDRFFLSIRAMLQQFCAGPVAPIEALFIVGPKCLGPECPPGWLRRARDGDCPFPEGLLPQGLTGRILIVKQRDGSQKVHDRFVLTEIGGVRFTVGLDEGRPGQTDGCHRLAKAHWEEAWSDYVEGKGFDLVEEW